MKKSVLKIALLIALCVLVCALVGCDKADKGGFTLTNDDTKGVIYVVEDVKKGIFGDAFAPAEKYEDGTVLNLGAKTVGNYFIESVKVNGEAVAVKNNIFSVTVSGKTAVEVTYFDRSTNEVLAARRDLVEQYVRAQMGTLFMYDKDYTYTLHFKPYTLKAGQLYRGIPYSNYSNTSLEGYLDGNLGQDENGIYLMGGEDYSVPRFELVRGNNCCDVIYWAWSQISDGISFRYAQETTASKGALRLGNYEFSRPTYVDTKLTVSENDYDVMFDSYARILKGDAGVNYFNGGGHVILFVDNHVEYLDDGSIDPDKSYVLYHDQNGAYKPCTVTVNGEEVEALSSGLLDKKVTYSWLFTNGYLPVTCEELINPAPIEDLVITDSEAGNLNKSTVTKGEITTNYYMSHLTMTITDSTGAVVQQATRHSNEMNTNNEFFDMSYFTDLQQFGTDQAINQYADTDVINVGALAAGNYHCKVTITTVKGGEQVLRDFDFTV